MKTIVIVLLSVFISFGAYAQERPIASGSGERITYFDSKYDSISFASKIKHEYAGIRFRDSAMVYTETKLENREGTYPSLYIYMNQCYIKKRNEYFGSCKYIVTRTKDKRYVLFMITIITHNLKCGHDLEAIKRGVSAARANKKNEY